MRILAIVLSVVAVISVAVAALAHHLGLSGWWSAFIGLVVMAAFNFIIQGIQADYTEYDTVRMDGVSRVAFGSNVTAAFTIMISMIGSWLVAALGDELPYSAAQYAVIAGSLVMTVHLVGYALIALVMAGIYMPPRGTD